MSHLVGIFIFFSDIIGGRYLISRNLTSCLTPFLKIRDSYWAKFGVHVYRYLELMLIIYFKVYVVLFRHFTLGGNFFAQILFIKLEHFTYFKCDTILLREETFISKTDIFLQLIWLY